MAGIVIDSVSGDVQGPPTTPPESGGGGGAGGGGAATPESDMEEMLSKLRLAERRQMRLRAD